MKELLGLLFSFKFRELFFEKTENGLIKFFRYAFVGGIAFVVDYLTFTAVCQFGESQLVTALATVAGFITGIITNFILSKKFVFQEESTAKSAYGEFVGYAVIGIIGCVLNILLMMFATGVLSVNRYIAKIIVAVIVLFYNYISRKIILYTPSEKGNRG